MNAHAGSPRILIVDDEADWVWLIRQRLALHRFDCLTAASGPEAWTVARRERPDAIILDLMLPGEHGLLVLRRLKSDRDLRQMKVIIMTALTSAQSRADALRSGADAYFEKPFSLNELVQTLDRLMGRDTGSSPPAPSTSTAPDAPSPSDGGPTFL